MEGRSCERPFLLLLLLLRLRLLPRELRITLLDEGPYLPESGGRLVDLTSAQLVERRNVSEHRAAWSASGRLIPDAWPFSRQYRARISFL